MAKRRKETEEEQDTDFKIPKFDEQAFLKRERRSIKSTFISFLFGCLMALVCFGFWALMGRGFGLRWELVLLVAVVNAIFLKYIFIKLKIDLTDFGRKNWFGAYVTYFFTWFIVLIILVNPPFYDDEDPRIELVIMPKMQEPGGDIFIIAKITDNTGMEKKDITLTVDNILVFQNDFNYIDNIFEYIYTGPTDITNEETHNFSLSVKDHGGNVISKTDTFTFSEDTIYLALPKNGDEVFAADDIKFGVKTNVFRVYYRINEKNETNATQQVDRKDYYTTSPEYKGWVSGENISVKVSAELLYNFENNFLKDEKGNYILDTNNNAIPRWYVNYINDSSTYYFNVASESTIGQLESPEISRLSARIVVAPGFEILILLIALVMVVLTIKLRKKKRQ
jgi:heme/copper-type cytochrome/quinol oxidase subunit 4